MNDGTKFDFGARITGAKRNLTAYFELLSVNKVSTEIENN